MDEPKEQVEDEVQPQQPVEEKKELKKPKVKLRVGLLVLHIISVIILIGGAAAGVYYWRQKIADDAAAKLNSQIDNLEKSVMTLASQNNASSSTTGTTVVTTNGGTTTGTTTTGTTTTVSDTTKTNITLAVSTINTQPLEGYMADSVNVILAATEAYGPQTAAQATADVTTFLGTSTSATWDFNLSQATINSTYGTSGYSQYFPSGALVGKSSDNKVISFVFNSSGKISTIFMASAAELVSN